MNAIAAKLASIPQLPAIPPIPTVGGSSSGGFSDVLASAIGEVEVAQSNATAVAKDLLSEGKGDVHNVALAAQRAELTLELFQQVRNKFVQAYQEIMRMPM